MKGLLVIVVSMLAAVNAAAQEAPRAAPAPMTPFGASSLSTSIHPAVARIVAPGEGNISYGSGTLVYANDTLGLVVTNWHVINEATGPISVHFPDGFYSPGTVQKIDRDWDLALIAIRKPNAAPVALAGEAPRPGELLTIAGYGSGAYRAASGPCTQYVAPGTTFPFEMVEVAVSARQGDSGGPIFNARGELAGVLFGEGQGRTSGSYCGRVRWFLASVAPGAVSSPAMVAAAPLSPVGPRPRATGSETPAEPNRFAQAPLVQTNTQLLRAERSENVLPATAILANPQAATPPPIAQVQTIGWEDIAGATFGEQVKSVLAAVGVLAVLLHTLRWLGSERPAA